MVNVSDEAAGNGMRMVPLSRRKRVARSPTSTLSTLRLKRSSTSVSIRAVRRTVSTARPSMRFPLSGRSRDNA